MKICDYIKSIRKGLGLTQNGFAEKLKTHRCNIANYETGRVIPPGNIILKIQELEKQNNRISCNE